ncbi:MAG: CAAX amino terminal protease family [halophilic archaeon J07HB67]|nr:MAG: CAAX amino terminal protease family [halophilic archaeon J07HB67]
MQTRLVTLDRRIVSVVAVLGAIGCVLAAENWVEGLLSGSSGPFSHVVETVKFGLILAVGVVALRLDGGEFADVGLSREFFLPGVAAFLATYAVVNALGVALAATFGLPWGVDVLADQLTSLTTPLALGVCYAFVEEAVVRGYLQTKFRSLLGANGPLRRLAAVVVTSVLFALLHVPRMFVEGGYIGGSVVGTLVALTLSGVGFGLLFELSGNVYFVGLIHALGNTWVLLVDGFAWSGTTFLSFAVAVLVAYFGVTFAYRRAAADTAFTPHVRVGKRAGADTGEPLRDGSVSE